MAKETGQQGFWHTGAIQENDLKICDLCGSLNLESNPECFVCGWHSHFERSHEVVRAAVEMAVRRNGRLELQDLTDVHTYREQAPTLQIRFAGWFHRIWSWLTG
jgi:hypothetical protein